MWEKNLGAYRFGHSVYTESETFNKVFTTFLSVYPVSYFP